MSGNWKLKFIAVEVICTHWRKRAVKTAGFRGLFLFSMVISSSTMMDILCLKFAHNV